MRKRQQLVEIWVKEGIDLKFPIINKCKNSLVRKSYLTKTQREQRQELMEIWVKERIGLEFPIINKSINLLKRKGDNDNS
jgi:hypothetical protein